MLSYISNNCLAQSIYFKENREYDNPFIGSLFVNDKQYVKFCQNFNSYIKIEPKFDNPKPNSIWAQQNKNIWYKHDEIKPPYPVMFLHDIEIHWIHELDTASLLAKYNRRIERFLYTNPTPIFILSVSDLCNDHNIQEYDQLIKDFIEIPTSFYLTKYKKDTILGNRISLIEKWIGTNNERNISHIPNIHIIGDRLEYILQLFSLHDMLSFV
jgi:uncharacterized protein (DUF1919 family)